MKFGLQIWTTNGSKAYKIIFEFIFSLHDSFDFHLCPKLVIVNQKLVGSRNPPHFRGNWDPLFDYPTALWPAQVLGGNKEAEELKEQHIVPSLGATL